MAQNKKGTCFTCRHQKALLKFAVPCSHCYAHQKWQKMTDSQVNLKKKEEKIQEYRENKKQGIKTSKKETV